jgi:D-alanyl-D-alanine carboxypeptidase/D-alanyl-D-alanine-endopeptidase (penicillin-binding protein 4)
MKASAAAGSTNRRRADSGASASRAARDPAAAVPRDPSGELIPTAARRPAPAPLRRLRRPLLSAAQAEADAAHRLQQRLAGGAGQLAAEVAHVHVHHVALRVEVHVPDLLEQGGAAHDLLGVQQEVLQELEFLGGEVQRAIGHAHRMPQAVQRDRPVAEHLEPLRTAPAMQRADPGEQLVEAEGLGEVVVRAGIEPANHVLHRVARGEHQDRRVPPFAAQLGRHLKSVLLRQHHVEQDHVVVVDVGEHGRLLAVGRDVHHVALFLQALLDEPGDLPVVLHDENFHGRQSRGAS